LATLNVLSMIVSNHAYGTEQRGGRASTRTFAPRPPSRFNDRYFLFGGIFAGYHWHPAGPPFLGAFIHIIRNCPESVERGPPCHQQSFVPAGREA
jgi:hypothetical protein